MAKKTIENYSYEVDGLNVLRVWQGDEEAPMFLQPDWPDSTPWADAAEAEAWGVAAITALLDPTAPLAGITPSEPTMPRPVEEPAVVEEAAPTSKK